MPNTHAKPGKLSAAKRRHAEKTTSSPHVVAGRQTLLLVPEIFSSEGGIPRICQLYLRALCDLAGPNDQIRLIALNDDFFCDEDLQRVTGGRLTEAIACGKNKARFIATTLRLSRKTDHIVCAHVAQLPTALAARTVNPRLRYDLIAHGIEVWRPIALVERIALRKARHVFCVSDYTRRQLLHRCPLPAGKAVVLANALDPAFPIAAEAPPAPVGPPTIVLVARLNRADREKGFESMIQAMPAVREAIPTARLQIIGRGDALTELVELSRHQGTEDCVDFLGYVDDARMREALRDCTLFALPSGKEGFGLVYIEAMASGRPCLGARAGGVPEVITPETGVLVELGNVASLAGACVAALNKKWNASASLARAHHFSYPVFKERLRHLLPA